MLGFLAKLGLDILTLSRRKAAGRASVIEVRPLLQLKAELHQGVVYCFEQGTDRFICQGSTLDQIKNAYLARFPHAKDAVSITHPTPEVVAFLKNQKNELGAS